MDTRSELLRKLTGYQFAALDMQLYLDTHPNDMNALMMYNGYRKSQQAAQKQYESLYGPLSSDMVSDHSWEWVHGPWPWEREAN